MTSANRVSLLIPLLLLGGCQRDALAPGSDSSARGPSFAASGTAPANPAIAFGKGSDLVVMNADGTNQAALTSTVPGGQPLPSWAPFGTGAVTNPYAIVFESNLCQISRIDVVVVNGTPQGSHLTSLPTTSNACHPAWSPLGSEIAFGEAFTDQPPSSLWVMPAQGGTQVGLYHAPSGFVVRSPTWSPDGARIAFEEQNEATRASAIKIVDRATGTPSTVLQLGAGLVVKGLDWARTKDVVAYSVVPFTGGDEIIYTLSLNPVGAPTRVTSGTGPSWSPDDSKLVFRSGTAPKIAVIDLATARITRLTTAGAWPDWRRF
ncbi:MAG: hypothetical protein Q8S13_08375 [Dehalococcoidia bacterium]|nr:hypothetical protein [Dehalococcoidia bacterium]